MKNTWVACCAVELIYRALFTTNMSPSKVKISTGVHALPRVFVKDVIIATTNRLPIEPDGLTKIFAAVMQSPDVQQLKNQAAANGSNAYMEF